MIAARSHHARTGLRPVVVYSRDAILRIEEVAAGLLVSVRTVERMDLPTIYLAGRTKRFLWGQILDTLSERAE